MQKLETIQLVIFDLDGTLVNSQYDICDALNYALRQIGKPEIALEDVPKLLGGGIKKLIELALEKSNEELKEKTFKIFKEHYATIYANKTDFYPGVKEALLQMSNIKKAVFSNKAHEFTQEIVRKTGFFDEFELVYGYQPDLYPLKPSSKGLELILNKLHILPENALMVGDSTHDMKAAQAIGMKSCAVTYGYRSADILKATRPDLIIDKMGELLQYLELRT